MDIYFSIGKYVVLVIAAILFVLLLILVRIKYSMVLLLNILLLSVVFIEPSPSDIIFIIFIIFMFKNKNLQLSKLREHSFFIVFFYLYILINIIGLLNVFDYISGIKFLCITLYLILYSIYIFLFAFQDNYKQIILAYVISCTFSAILGIIGYLGILSSYLTYDLYRTKALFKDPNVFGPFLIPAIIFLIDDVSSKKIISSNKIIHLSLIVINLVGLFLSFSRGAWINLAIVIFLYVLLNKKRIKFSKVTIYIIICVLVISFLWTFVLVEDFKDFILERCKLQNYDKARFTVQKIGLNLIEENILGYGPGQYELSVINYIGAEYSAHSLYMRLIVENGIIGFICFLFGLVYVMVMLLKVHISGDNSIIIKSSVLLSILCGLSISSIAIDTLHWRHMWLFIGLSLSVIYENKCIEKCSGDYQ